MGCREQLLRIDVTNDDGGDPGPGFGIGLSSTRGRLDRLYGDRYGLTIDRSDDRVRVRLQLPALPAEPSAVGVPEHTAVGRREGVDTL